jgi:hypothetical protein
LRCPERIERRALNGRGSIAGNGKAVDGSGGIEGIDGGVGGLDRRQRVTGVPSSFTRTVPPVALAVSIDASGSPKGVRAALAAVIVNSVPLSIFNSAALRLSFVASDSTVNPPVKPVVVIVNAVPAGNSFEALAVTSTVPAAIVNPERLSPSA